MSSDIPPQQPNPYATPADSTAQRPPGAPPKTYLPESIFCLICCGGVFAIPAIIFAAQVTSKYNMGDYAGAQSASNNAKLWCIIAVCIGLVLMVLFVGLQFIAIGFQAQNF